MPIQLIHHPLKYQIDNLPESEWSQDLKKIREIFNNWPGRPTGQIYKYLCWLFNEDLDANPTEWKWDWAE